MSYRAFGTHRHAVLLVEDDQDTRQAFTALACAVGLHLLVVENGRAALDLLNAGLRPCLIVLDLLMPEMDGLSFRRAQLADAALRDVPVAVVSGCGPGVQAEAWTLGLTVFLRKPIDPGELVRAFFDHCREG